MVCKKDDNSIFKNVQDRWGISYLSKHLSDVKRNHLLASAAKLIFCGLSPFYRGADKFLARPTSRSILFDGENISFDASLVIFIYYIYIIYN